MAEKVKNKFNGNGVPPTIPDEVLYGGKVPPHSKELEQNVLGGIMLDNKLYDVVEGIINDKMFYVTANQDIYRAMGLLRAAGQPADMITISEQLKVMGLFDAVGGAHYLAELSGAFSSQESIEFSAIKIKENWVKRDMIMLAYNLSEKAYDPVTDAIELVNTAQEGMLELGNYMHGGKEQSIDETFMDMVLDTEKRCAASGEEKMSGIPSHITEFNERTGGYQRQELTIIAGRPSHGKSAATFQEALQQAENGYHVGIFSIEMSERELMMRLAAIDQEIDLLKFKLGTLTVDDFGKLAKSLKKMKSLREFLHIDYRNPVNVQEIRSKCREWKQKYGLDIVYVDYLGLMESGKKEKYWENSNVDLGYITKGLKQVAKELDIAMVVLSQMSRKIEDRGIEQRWPQLSDLRDSGNIEQDADMVVFITRPEVWYENVPLKLAEWKGKAVWNIAKQRNGPVGSFDVVFRGRFGKFENFSKEYKSDMPGNYNQPEIFDNREPF